MAPCQQAISGVITSGSPIAAGTFAGTLTLSNFVAGVDSGSGDIAGTITLTESAIGDQFVLTVSGRVIVSFITGAFSFSGSYTITRGTGRFAGATGAGSAAFAGTNDPVAMTTTITSFTLSGIIIL